jgi:hypothetical protein
MMTMMITTINNNVIITTITILFGRAYFASTDTKVV